LDTVVLSTSSEVNQNYTKGGTELAGPENGKDQRPENAGPGKWRTRVHQSRQVMTLFESKQQVEFKSWRWVEFGCRHQTTESGES